jgi:SAM-dependent methyltransferase
MNQPTAPLDAHAPAYTPAFAHFEENRIVHEAYGLAIAARLRELGARRVLSLGVGHRDVARPIIDLLRAGALDQYTIVDAAPAMLEALRVDIAPVPAGMSFVEAYFEHYASASAFDAIEAGFVLEHVEDPALLLRRMRGLLAPGGRMFVAVPNALSLHRRVGHAAGLVGDLHALSPADLALGHRRYFDVERLAALAMACGLRSERHTGLLLKPFTTGQLNQLDLPAEVWRALQVVAAPYPELANAFSMELVPCD